MIDHLRALVAAMPDGDVAELDRLYRLAEAHHRGQLRRSGDPYITHPVAVAVLVARWGLPAHVVQAALVHDVDVDVLRGQVSARVVDLVTGLDRLNETPEAATQDVLVLKLADRLHNARTSDFVPRRKARRKARENLRLYVPHARALGLAEVGGELDRLSVATLGAGPRLRDLAVSLLPAEERARYRREWSADLASLTSRRERAAFGVGLVWSAGAMRRR